jgi:hypothetical protein
LFHRARCDSSFGSSSNSVWDLCQIICRDEIDSSDDDSSQDSNSTLSSEYKAEYVVGYFLIPPRQTQDSIEIARKNSDNSDNSAVMPPIKKLQLEDDGSVQS